MRILFVLSGFVLSLKYFGNGYSEKKLLFDSVKRYFRLFPPLLVTDIAVWLLMRAGLLFNQQVALLSGSVDFLGMFNVFDPDFIMCVKEGFFGNLFTGANAYVGPMWTMQYEMYGSLLVLAVLSVASIRRVRYIFYLCFCIFFRSYYVYFVIGMLVCELYYDKNFGVNKWFQTHEKMASFLFILVTAYVAMAENIDSDHFHYVMFSVMLVAMFYLLLYAKSMDILFKNRIIQYLAKHSFAIYLVHWPIIESFSCGYYLALYEKVNKYIILVTNFCFTVVIILFVSKLLTDYIITPGVIVSNKVAEIIIGESK